jgi:hypothetical protein
LKDWSDAVRGQEDKGGEWSARGGAGGENETRSGGDGGCHRGASAKASTEKIRDRIASAAREGWSKVKMKLRDRWLTREGDELVVEDRKGEMNEEGKGNEEAIVDLLDTGDGGTVEVKKDSEGKDDTWSRTSGESRRMRMGFDFLEIMKEGTVDEDLEKTRKSDKK